MGWRGTMRSINAAAKASIREAERRQKIALKEAETENAAQDVRDWQDYLNGLKSIHASITDRIDWVGISKTPEPKAPRESTQRTIAAEAALMSFKPSFFATLLGKAEKKRQKLIGNVNAAKKEDEHESSRRALQHQSDLANWEKEKALSERVLAGDETAFLEVIEKHQSLLMEEQFGKGIIFVVGHGKMSATVEVHTDEIVPNFRRKQLASGRLSQTKMPKGDFNDIYQDYVASVSIRVAGDMFQMLPLVETVVTCSSRMLNSATGHQEVTPILSVLFVRDSFERLRLDRIDPSDALVNFKHNMDFKRTRGFAAIIPIEV